MFTGRKAFLSKFADVAGIEVVRDAEISYVGKIPTDLDGRVVPAAKSQHLESARAYKGISAFIVPAEIADLVPSDVGLAIASSPQVAAGIIQEMISCEEDFQWEGFPSKIHESAQISPGAYVAPRDVVIGANTYIGPNAAILPRSIIGSHCSIGAGTGIGMEAFDQAGHAKYKRLLKQSGGVLLADHVTIQANCTISRATFGGFTSIGKGTLIDALVYIAHDGKIGDKVTICSNVSISGRVTIEEGAYIGPQAAISNGLTVAEGATVSIGAVVTKNVLPKTRVTGNFAIEHAKWLSFIRKYR